MTTVGTSEGPKLDLRVEVGVQIIKLPTREEVAASLGCAPTDPAVMEAATALAGPATPTDIVVFDHKPWHKVAGALREHPQVHIDYPETLLDISFSKQQRAVWWSTEPFTITTIKPSDHHGGPAGAGAAPATAPPPTNPFNGPPPPYPADRDPGLTTPVYFIRARPIVATSVGHVYKISFTMNEEIDPDMSCSP